MTEAVKEPEPIPEPEPDDDEQVYGRFKGMMDRYFVELEGEVPKPVDEIKPKAEPKIEPKTEPKPSAAEQRASRASGGNFFEMMFGSSKPKKHA